MTLDIRQAGDLIGLNVLTDDDETYPVTATCVEDAVLCGLTRDGFERLVLEHPAIGLQVIRNLSTRLAGLNERVESMALTSLETLQRVRRWSRTLASAAYRGQEVPKERAGRNHG